MNLPNRITVLRMLLIPVFLVLISFQGMGFRILATAVFLFAAATDYVDGALARSRGEITDFGKFIDPIADKLLVLTPMILLTANGGMWQLWAVMLMIAREFVVSGFRLVAAAKGVVIAAGWAGKIKTVAQIGVVVWLTLQIPYVVYALWAAAALSLYSGALMFLQNRGMLRDMMRA
jgi:CDP-diacylglycerol--glycerol-3-phosphate 3-phosphatidyltransferase